MQVKSIFPAEPAGPGQVAPAGISASFPDLLAVLLQGVIPPRQDALVLQESLIQDSPADLPPRPDPENEDNPEAEWAVVSLLQCVNSEQAVPAPSLEPEPAAGEISKESCCMPVERETVSQLSGVAWTEVEAGPVRPDLADKTSEAKGRMPERPVLIRQQSVVSREVVPGTPKTAQAVAELQLPAADSKVILPDAKAQIKPEVIPDKEPQSVYPRAPSTETLFQKTGHSDGGRYQKDSPAIHLPLVQDESVTISDSGPAPAGGNQEAPSPEQLDRSIEIPAAGKVFPGKPPEPEEKSGQPSAAVPATDYTRREPDNPKSELPSSASIPHPNREALNATMVNKSSPQVREGPRPVPADRFAVPHEAREPAGEKLPDAGGSIARVQEKGTGTRPEPADPMPTLQPEAEHHTADAVAFSKIYGADSAGRQEIVLPAAEVEQIPAAVFRHLTAGQGGRQIIFKLDPPELGQVLVTIKEHAQKGLEARVVLDRNIPQQQVDALAARFAEISRPEVHVRIEIAAGAFSGRQQEDSTVKKERDRNHARRNNVKSANNSTVFYG